MRAQPGLAVRHVLFTVPRSSLPRADLKTTAVPRLLSARGLGGSRTSSLVLEWSGYEAEDFWTDFQRPTPTPR